MQNKLPSKDHVAYVKKVMIGEGEDEPRIHFDETKSSKKVGMDARSMWEDAQRNVFPGFERSFWDKLKKH